MPMRRLPLRYLSLPLRRLRPCPLRRLPGLLRDEELLGLVGFDQPLDLGPLFLLLLSKRLLKLWVGA